MKRTNNSDNRSLLGQIIKIEEVPPLTSMPNEVNSPRIIQREPTQVRGFGNGIAGHSQAVLNPSLNQLESTNIGLISPTINTIDQPRLTQQMFPAAIAAISSNDLETAMKIVGVKSIEELAYSTDILGYTLLAYAAEYGRAKPIRILLNKVLDPQQLMQKRNNKNCTPLILAAIFGHTKAITTILQGVSNPQQLAEQIDDAKGATALHYAVLNGHETVVTAILRNVPNPQKLAEQKNKYEYPALHDAVENGLVAVVTALFSNVSNPQQLAEQQDGDGDTTLMATMRSSQNKLIIAKIFEYVVDAEKLIFQENDDEVNSFIYALNRDYMEAALLLFDKAKDKASLLLKKNSPNQPAAIQTMKPEIQDVFLKKYNEPNH